MRRVVILLKKDWREIFVQRGLIVALLAPPVFLTLMPIIVVYGMQHIEDKGVPGASSLGPFAGNMALVGLSARELAQAVTGQQFGLLMLLLPMIIPSVIAAQAIVGEKQKRTLEPLLATPVRTWELLLAKCLSALLPAVVLSWACAGLFALAMHEVALTQRVADAIVTPGLWLVHALCSPLLALFSIGVMVIASSRVNDPRTAQQLSGLLVLPVAGAIVGQVTGKLVLDPTLALMTTGVLFVLDIVVIVLAVRLFDRETILTRWR